MNWVATVLGAGGLLTAVVTAVVSFRRLPAENGLTEAQREQTMVATAREAAQMVRADLGDCKRECAELRSRIGLLERHDRALEAILRTAGIPVPVMGGGE